MIHSLQTKHVGPIENLDITFGSRFNVITGDNGLGKSFLLDLVWWSLTRTWVQKINPKLTHGYMARPHKKEKGEISYQIYGDIDKSQKISENISQYSYSLTTGKSTFNYEAQAWEDSEATKSGNGIVLYSMPDGSFALWDSVRNRIDSKNADSATRQSAFIFSLEELWNGLETKEGTTLCNGVIRDWASWQKEDGIEFEKLQKAIKHLSVEEEGLEIGKLTRIDINDARDIPTILMPYGEEVPIVYASSAIKRIIAFAYLLVWSMSEHSKACELLNKTPSRNITFLIDELDAHLHPRWQRTILPSLLEVMYTTPAEANDVTLEPHVQLIVITHSPFTLLSLEGNFDESEESEKDVWLDIDFDSRAKTVIARQRQFLPKGDVSNWLTSDAFDLETDFSLEKEKVFVKLTEFLAKTKPTEVEARNIALSLDGLISELDPLWLDFLDLCEEKGWDI